MSRLWLGYKIGFDKTKKKLSAAQRGGQHDNTMNERDQA